MSIQSYIKELDSIKAEIKRNTDSNKILRARSKTVENEIKDYLEYKDQEGVRFKDKSFVLEHSISYKRKPKKDKEEETKRLLQSMGVTNTEHAYSELLSVQKGKGSETTKLRVKTTKKRDEY